MEKSVGLSKQSDEERQRAYYRATVQQYDAMHIDATDEHTFALHWLDGLIRFFGIRRVLDVGCGTGRAGLWLSHRLPDVEVFGLEPVPELAAEAIRKGYPPDRLIGGSALAIPFPDDSFDLVCEFGVLHHIRDDRKAVQEMVRVARRAVFLSDSNNFGHGSPIARFTKQWLHKTGLWPVADFIKTRGKGYSESTGDGIAYSYTVFDSVAPIRIKFPNSYYMNTAPSDHNLYRTAPSVAVFLTR